jgi:hypothetical protein
MREAYATVDGAVLDVAIHRFTQHHGAGPAVAFVTAFLGAHAVQVLAQHL